jgi:hypothetical protein
VRLHVGSGVARVDDEARVTACFRALQHVRQIVRLDGLPSGFHFEIKYVEQLKRDVGGWGGGGASKAGGNDE